MATLGYLILYVPDVAAAIAFYERAFGLTQRFVDPAGQYGELSTGATALAFAAESLADTHKTGYVPARPDARPAAFEIAFVVEDVRLAYDRALAAGCSAVSAAEVKPWGQTVAYVRDLNGFIVELCTPVGA